MNQRINDWSAPSRLDMETLLQLYKARKIPLHDLIKLLGQQQAQSAAKSSYLKPRTEPWNL